MNIVQSPNPVLSKVAKDIVRIDSKIKKIVDDMILTLNSAKDPEGVGLAAPQVGESIQLFITKPTLKSKIKIFINPKIIEFIDDEKSKKSENDIKLEGCLSIKDIWGVVKRHKSLKMSYTDIDGKQHEEIFRGFEAVILQHEFDHLQGILFPKRVLEQQGKLYKSKKDADGEMVFEEIII